MKRCNDLDEIRIRELANILDANRSSRMRMINVTTVYPADPLGNIPGGIDTLIRDIIRCAPSDFKYTLLGATTDPVSRPAGQWTRCTLGNTEFDFFPVYAIKDPGKQPRFPATIRHLAPLLLRRPAHQIDILESHRIEPLLAYLRHPAPWFAFIHQDMANLQSAGSDIRWKYAPKLYSRLEDWLIPKFHGLFCVHEQAVLQYRQRFPDKAENIRFMPTWTNPDIFFPVDGARRDTLRGVIQKKYDIEPDAKLLISVGRIDRQKNPDRLVHALSALVKSGQNLHVILVGDGVLRDETDNLVIALGLRDRVTFAGLLPNQTVADYVRACDLLVLSSDYEGMPVCAIEALACGIPVASTPVGEISKVVRDSVNGKIASGFEVDEFAIAISECLKNLETFRGQPCIDAARNYTPERILAPVFESYRQALR